jgi:hypothetical protein
MTSSRRLTVPTWSRLGTSPWPEFLGHDEVVNDLWHLLYETFPDYQFALIDSQDGDLMAIGNCIPIVWAGNLDAAGARHRRGP